MKLLHTLWLRSKIALLENRAYNSLVAVELPFVCFGALCVDYSESDRLYAKADILRQRIAAMNLPRAVAREV